MPVDIRFQAPFIPQEGITSQILTAIQLANEQHYRRQQLAIEQQQANTAQQQASTAASKAPAEIEEAKARAGLYGPEAQKIRLENDRIRETQQMFSSQPQQQSAQPVATGPYVPQGTPPQLQPMVGAMLPQDLSDDERPLIESAAAAGAQKARETGMVSDYLTAINKGVTDVQNRRLQLQSNPDKQPVTPDDIKNFNTNILPSMENLSPAQKKLASSAAAGAKSQKDLRDVRDQFDRIDAQRSNEKIQQANRVSNENLAHQLQLDKDGRDKIIAANTKWSDAQTQINLGVKTIQAAANGDDLATRIVPTMEVLGINMTGGIKRISPTEAQAAQIPVSWTNRFNQWVDSRTKGATDAELVKEGKRLFGDLAEARYSSYLAEQKSNAANYKINAGDVSVINNNGQSVTLDKALKGGTKPDKGANLPAGAISGTLNGQRGYVLNGEFYPN